MKNMKGAANQTYMCTGGRKYVADKEGFLEDVDGRDIAHMKLNGATVLTGDEYWRANPDEERPKPKQIAKAPGDVQ